MAINRDKVEAAAIKLLQQGKYDKAIIEFRKLVDDDKTDVRNLLKLGETYVKVGAKKESIEAYERAAAIYTEQGFYLKAVAVFKQILRVDQNVPELHLKLAELYQQLGLTSDALAHYQTVAVFYEQQGRPRDALDMLKRMVDLDPDNIASRIKLGELFAQQGLAQEATGEMRSALNFLKQQQRFDDYVRVGEKLVAYDAGALDVARELAQIYMQRQQPSVALGKLQMCFKADPRNVEVLAMIAQAFLDMQQVPKTISVFKEMAKIYSADGQSDLATRTWERVLELSPGDAEAEQALGRVSPQVTRPTLVPTVVAPAQAGAPMGGPHSAAPPRANPEDEQLQRLLTETDVYVKYGLKEKAIEHLQKVFAVRSDHVPALEKLKILQQQIGGGGRELADTLRRLVRAAEAQGHIRVDEWRGELERAASLPRPATQPSLIIPVSQSASGEGDIVIDESSGSMLPEEPIVEPDPSGVIRLDDNASGIIALDPSQPDESFLGGDGSMMDDLSGSPALPPDEQEGFDAPPAKFEIPRMPTGVMKAPPARAEPARPEPMMRPEPMRPEPMRPEPIRPEPMRAPVPAPPPVQVAPAFSSSPPSFARQMPADDVVDLNDADALVRKALQDISAEDLAVAADELLLEASADDILPGSAEGAPLEPLSGAFHVDTGQNRTAGVTSASHEPQTLPTRSGISGPDDDEIDRLAREAVADANRSLAADLKADVQSTALMNLSQGELDEIRDFEGDTGSSSSSRPSVTPEGATVVRAAPLTAPSSQSDPNARWSLAKPALPPEMSGGDDDGFNDPTLALLPPSRSSDLPTDERPRRKEAPRPTTQPSLLTNRPSSDDDDNVPTLSTARPRGTDPSPPPAAAQPSQPPASPSTASPSTAASPTMAAAFASSSASSAASKSSSAIASPVAARPAVAPVAAPPPVVGDFSEEFDPSSFDLPADVKELLRKDAGGAEEDTGSLPELDAPSAFNPAQLDSLDAMSLDAEVEASMGRVAPASTPAMSAAFASSSPARTNVELPREMDGDMLSEASGEVTLRGKLGLQDKAQGFEDDPANQFFPDELEEAEFFIQQELLDEAKDILTAILDDVPESARVQWMLARVAAKENGEAEPPAPWEQRILEEVQAQLEDLGIAEGTSQRPAEPGLGDGTAQVSVEEVLSQFKKGVAETVPEEDAATHYELGIAYKEMGLHDDAVLEFQIAARAPSRAADARYMVGIVRLEQGNREEALAGFEDAVAVPTASKDQRGAAEYQRGLVLEELNRLPEALRAFKAAKMHGNGAVDIDRRIKALVDKVGDVDGPLNGSNGNGANGHGKAEPKNVPGRGPKNIDYL